jgi:CheY-like chemotaxis protein
MFEREEGKELSGTDRETREMEKSQSKSDAPSMYSAEAKPEKSEDEKAEERAEARAEEEVGEGEVKRRIIVIDSMEKTLDEAIGALRKGEYSVIGVETAEEFFDVTKGKATANEESDIKAVTPEAYWEIAKGNVPDLLITDLNIRDLDGWELLYRLKFDNRYYEYWNIPIIVRTDAPITIETVKKIPAESIHDYFSKKIKGKELLQKIDKFFETKKKLGDTKKEITDNIGFVVAKEYGRIFLAARIRLKYVYALKARMERLKEEGGDPQEIKNLQDVSYLQNRDVIKYERRKLEIKKTLKEKKKVKKIDRGAEDRANAKVKAD